MSAPMQIEQDQGVTLSTTVEVPAVPYASETQFLWMASIKAPFYKPNQRAPLDLVTVIDRSGSMSGQKINLCKETLEFVITQLESTDRLSIVEYDDYVNVCLGLTKMDQTGKKQASQAAKNIHVGGSTNLCGGLQKGVEIMSSRGSTKNEVSSVLLLTDGQANVGPSNLSGILHALRTYSSSSPTPGVEQMSYPPSNIMPLQPQQVQQMPAFQNQQMPNFQVPMQQVQQIPQVQQQMPTFDVTIPAYPKVQQLPPQQYQAMPQFSPVNNNNVEKLNLDLPCNIYTFGYGSDHDPNLLKGLAEAGNGVYYFIKDNKDVPESFADCLGGLLSVAAQNITLKFEAKNGAKINKLITKFKLNEIKPNEVYEITIGDIQSEESRDIIISAQLPALSEEKTGFEFADITVNYFNVLNSTLETKVASAVVARPAVIPSGQKRHYELDKQYNRLIAAEAMKQATELGNQSKLEEARKLLEQASSRIKESVSANDDFCKGLVVDLQKCADGLRDRVTFQNVGNQMLNTNMNAHYMQRSTNVQMASQQAYQTNARNFMQQQQQSKFS